MVYAPQDNPQVIYTQPATQTVVVQQKTNTGAAVAAGAIGFAAILHHCRVLQSFARYVAGRRPTTGRFTATRPAPAKGAMTMKSLALLATVAALVLAAPALPSAQGTEKLEISAFAINMGTTPTARNAQTVALTIDKWSTPEERDELLTVMIEKGPDALLRALQKQSVKGRFRIPGWQGPDPHQLGLGHDLRYTWQVPLPDGGRRITIATDRYIGFQEARTQARTMDYPFTFIQIQVNKEGEGEGKFAVATKIEFDKQNKRIELENWGSEPVRLNAVKVKVKK